VRQSLNFLVMVLTLVIVANAQQEPPLKLIKTIAMPGFTGDFDHFGLDLKGNRLFLAAEDHKTVEVFNLRTGKRSHSIEGFGHPLMMAYLPESNYLVVTDGGESAVQFVECKHYKIIKTVKLAGQVDHGVLNPLKRYYYVESGHGSGDSTHALSIVDTKSFAQIGDIPGLPGTSNEGMIIDRAARKLYVNLTGTDEVGVVDLQTNRLVSRWPLPGAHEAHAIALDERDHRLFIATRKPAQFIVFDSDTGKVITSLTCVGVNSDMWFDDSRKRIYVTGSNMASVIQQKDADHYEHVTEVPTAYRAKSSIFVSELNRLYVAVSGKGKPDAKLALQIYEVH
jgi:DNA-binding beta-propeller fold protein YncE